MRYEKENFHCNFSPRMQKNLMEAEFRFIDEQIYAKNEDKNNTPKFWVYEKTFELQLFLGMFRVNKEKLNNFYEECQIIKAYRECRLPEGITLEDIEIKANKFTKIDRK